MKFTLSLPFFPKRTLLQQAIKELEEAKLMRENYKNNKINADAMIKYYDNTIKQMLEIIERETEAEKEQRDGLDYIT